MSDVGANTADTPAAPARSWHARLVRVLASTPALALIIATLTSLVLLRGEGQIGYVRDEGVYFEASRHYAAWVARWAEEGEAANTPALRDRYFAINHEHPALMKLAAGVSARLFAEPPAPEIAQALERSGRGKAKQSRALAFRRDVAALEGGRWPWMREGAAMRLPAILLTGLGAALLFWAGRRLCGSVLGGLLACGAFVLLPRVAFHASLHAFDLPIAVMTLVLALAWRRAPGDWRWGLAMGPLLGVAIAVKHNALFLGPLFALHLWLCLALRWRRSGERPRLVQLAPMTLWSMAILGPLVALALWPWMWHETGTRLAEYFAFHSEHSYYNMEFWGVNYNRPPLPISYPFVMTWATVPSVLLLLTGAGVVFTLRTLRDPRALEQGDAEPADTSLASPTWLRPRPRLELHEEALLYLGLALFPLVLIALPSIPIFGGTKHWLTAYPFFALLAAIAWAQLWHYARASLASWPRLLQVGPVLLLVAVLAPGASATVHGHPFNLSQYAPLVGGARGAATLGLNRGFWGHSIVPLLEPEVLEARRVFVHDVHALALEQYRREARWPGWKRSKAAAADAALLFPERHMLSEEIDIWNGLGTTRPSMVLTLDDVPVTLVYE